MRQAVLTAILAVVMICSGTASCGTLSGKSLKVQNGAEKPSDIQLQTAVREN